jgi:hypothetical protein
MILVEMQLKQKTLRRKEIRVGGFQYPQFSWVPNLRRHLLATKEAHGGRSAQPTFG